MKRLIPFFLLLCAALPASATINVFQQGFTQNSAAATTVAVTGLTALSASHSLVLVIGGSSSATVSSITDNGTSHNTYTQATSCYGADTGGRWTDEWYVSSTVSGGITSVTVTASASQKMYLQVYDLTGTNTSAFFEQCVHGGSTTGTVDTGPSITTTNANDFIAAGLRTSGNGSTSENDATFTQDNTSSSGAVSHAIVTTAATYTPAWNDTAATTVEVSVASFKPASGGGGPVVSMPVIY